MSARSQGFTVVEAAIVVAILGLLAALAVPRLCGPAPIVDPGTDKTRVVLVLDQLRAAIDTYWSQHDGFPGQQGGEQLERQLCHATDSSGVSAPTAPRLGPYLAQGRLPLNPCTGTRSVRLASPLPGAPVGDEAWLYGPAMGEIRVNLPAFFDL